MRRATFSSSALSTGLDYGASYGCASDSPALIITRATEAAKFGEGASGWSGYSLLTNNCETFAYWCSTGRRVSRNKGFHGSFENNSSVFVADCGGGGCDGSGGCAEGFVFVSFSLSVAAVCAFCSTSERKALAKLWWTGRRDSVRNWIFRYCAREGS